jgi:hypothetical protein
MMKVVAVLLVFFLNALALSAQPSMVIQAKGNVERTLQADAWVQAKRADTLYLGNKLKTAKKSQSIIRFDDGSVLRVSENTELFFPVSSDPSVREVNVLKGLLTYNVNANASSPFRFRSPSGVAAIKGTAGSFETDGKAVNFVVESSASQNEVAEFESASGERKTLRIGEVAILSQSGRLSLRDIFESERKAIQSQISEMKQIVDAEIARIREEIEAVRQQAQAKADSLKRSIEAQGDSLKQELEKLKENKLKEEQERIKQETEKAKQELEKAKNKLKGLFK